MEKGQNERNTHYIRKKTTLNYHFMTAIYRHDRQQIMGMGTKRGAGEKEDVNEWKITGKLRCN